MRTFAKLLLIAVNETTNNLLSNVLLALLQTPGLEPQLRRDSSLCVGWIDETLRFDSPVQIVLRRAPA